MYLGIDIGTSAVKTVLVDDAQRIRAQATAPLVVLRPVDLWSEQDPDAWWAACEAAVLALPADLRSRTAAIGLSGQMHGAVLLGNDDRPLRPAILWNDGRSFAECADLETRQPDTRRLTGNMAMPGFTAPKLAWVAKHEPSIFAQVRSVLLPKDYIRLCMTGGKATDLSDASGTLWLDVGKRNWSDAMLAITGLDQSHMPAIHEGSEVTGTLRGEVAARWGMNRVPVAAGGGDNAAGAAGIGVIADGDALLSLGTSGVIFVATHDFRPNPDRAVHAFCHCLPGMWHQMSVHLSAASCVDWGARLCGTDLPGFFALAQAAGPAAGRELFLPYLSGERTPHNDPQVCGAFLGLRNESDPSRIAAAVLEGVAFALADGIAALREAGTRIDELQVIGGGARSRYWGSIIAASLDARLVYRDGGEVGPALGAAALAAMTTGATAAEACVRPPVSYVVDCDPQIAQRLAPKLEEYRRAYPAVASI